MADAGWLQTVLSALGGGMTVKVLDILYQEFRQRKSAKETAAKFVDGHLTPLLKSADELSGKLLSLAESDFKPIHAMEGNEQYWTDHEFASLLFLIGRFWAQIEIIRRDGMSIAMAQDERGARLQSFLDCLESRRIRLLERILQRAVGEVFANDPNGMTYVKFSTELERGDSVRKWVQPLAKFLSRMRHTSERQKLLQYGTVIHALIDSLDPEHLVTRDRPSWSNKLSLTSWRGLNYRVFGVYLKFVTDRHKYIGPPKRRRPATKGEGNT